MPGFAGLISHGLCRGSDFSQLGSRSELRHSEHKHPRRPKQTGEVSCALALEGLHALC